MLKYEQTIRTYVLEHRPKIFIMLTASILVIILFISIKEPAPSQWDENVTGVTTSFYSDDKEIALTFDACGSNPLSSQYDDKLIDFLTKNNIPATLFINSRWIDSNEETFIKLAGNSLFEIANHGTEHKPLSINGKSIYGIMGTNSKDEILREIHGNSQRIEKLTGKRPVFFRSGTAYYDEIAVSIARKEGVEIGGFSILADAGATYSSEKVAQQIKSAHSGDIIIAHMNHPESGTRDGVIMAVTDMLDKGYKFVRLSEVKDRLTRVP